MLDNSELLASGHWVYVIKCSSNECKEILKCPSRVYSLPPHVFHASLNLPFAGNVETCPENSLAEIMPDV